MSDFQHTCGLPSYAIRGCKVLVRKADLRLYFRIFKKPFFFDAAHFILELHLHFI